MFSTRAANINQLWANMIVEELVRLGIDRFVLSPGSRCSPLTVAAANHKGIEILSHFDERGAAYYALGYARATGKPAALVCTSGTATANYYPAVIEASMDMVPMMLLTADRPEELRHTGANQTIDQVELYGKYTRYFHDLPAPDLKISPETVVEVVRSAVKAAMTTPSGPAHINCQYREPLAPTGDESDFSEYLSNVKTWLGESGPFSAFEPAEEGLSEERMAEIASLISEAKSGLLVVGALTNDSDAQAVKQLSAKLQWPVFADIRSGLRLGSDKEYVIDYSDQILLSDIVDQLTPDVVLHLGNVMTSKRFNEYVTGCGCSHYIQVANHPLRRDPAGVVTERVPANIADFCADLKVAPKRQERVAFTKGLIEANNVVGRVINEFIVENPGLTEITLARLISKHIAKDTALFLGSSMPVRDMDMYADPSGNPVRVIANRGASGIDGSIATAVGYAGGLQKPVTAVIGDLAFLHDVNSLDLLRNSQQPVYLIVVNNNGGGIFSFLPIHECKDVFEKYFGTPHGLNCEKFAQGFGLNYMKPENTVDFVENYQRAQRDGKVCVIEVVTDREINRTVHLDLQERIRATLSSESDR